MYIYIYMYTYIHMIHGVSKNLRYFCQLQISIIVLVRTTRIQQYPTKWTVEMAYE